MGERRTTITVTWDDTERPQGVDAEEWAYTLRMGGIDADEVVVEREIPLSEHKHDWQVFSGGYECECGEQRDYRGEPVGEAPTPPSEPCDTPMPTVAQILAGEQDADEGRCRSHRSDVPRDTGTAEPVPPRLPRTRRWE